MSNSTIENNVNTYYNKQFSEFKQHIITLLKNHPLHEPLTPIIQHISDTKNMPSDSNLFAPKKRQTSKIDSGSQCCALTDKGTQCSRKRKGDNIYCGTHDPTERAKKIKHILQPSNQTTNTKTTRIAIHEQIINGIHYYIDNIGNVYCHGDIILDKNNPSIIANWTSNTDEYGNTTYSIVEKKL